MRLCTKLRAALARSRGTIWTALAVVAWGSALALFASELDGWRPGVPWVLIVAAIAITVTLARVVDRAVARATAAARPPAVRWMIPTQRTAPATYLAGGPVLTDLEGPTMRIATRAGQYDTVEQRRDDGEQLPPGAWADAYKLGRLAERRDRQRRGAPGA